MKKILVIGFGRMGFTHLAHMNGFLSGKCKFDVFDPSFFFRTAAFFHLRQNIRFLRRFPSTGKYDFVVITSPPSAHAQNFRTAFELSDSFFIEKPLGLTDEDLNAAHNSKKFVTCGYVLRKNPCIEYLRKVSQKMPPKEVSVEVRSNLGAHAAEDWRFDLQRGGGCINELGSHAINLGLSLVAESAALIDRMTVDELSVSKFRLRMSSSARLLFFGNWNEEVRKTMYAVSMEGSDYTLRTDLQSVSGTYRGASVDWSPRQEPIEVGYYMRGIDFALQTKSFLFESHDHEGLRDAILTDKLLKRVLAHA